MKRENTGTPNGKPHVTYGYPQISRSGLGNVLLPWARAWVWCNSHGAPMIAPSWFKFRIGPYLRRESDKRSYWRLFRSEGYITGLRKMMLLCSQRIVDEDQLTRLNDLSQGVVVTFSGLGNGFAPILNRHADIRTELVRITKPQFLPRRSDSPFIAVHIRRGDFSVPSDIGVLRQGKFNYRLPDEWYSCALSQVRSCLGSDLPARVFSDASYQELGFILREPCVELRRGRAAITDLLEISASSILIASGSTFSAWASYLGRMPVVWHKGQMRLHLYSGDARSAECELDSGGRLPGEWLETAAAAVLRARNP